MITPTSFLYEHDEATGIATLTLNRPERLNALTFDVYRELRDAFRSLGSESSVRVVIVTGAGKAFCSGGDVRDIIGALVGRDERAHREFAELTCDLIRAIRACPRPVIAAVNGTAAGAGAVIAAACDIRIASESARIAFLFTKVGLSGADMGIAWLLPRLVGLGRATELLMTGDFVSAEHALRIGLYNKVVPEGETLREAREFAATLAQGPPLALEKTKRALEAESAMTFAAALDAEAELQATLMSRPDFREAYDAFMARRRPRFS